jgi:hypothetical protein
LYTHDKSHAVSALELVVDHHKNKLKLAIKTFGSDVTRARNILKTINRDIEILSQEDNTYSITENNINNFVDIIHKAAQTLHDQLIDDIHHKKQEHLTALEQSHNDILCYLSVADKLTGCGRELISDDNVSFVNRYQALVEIIDKTRAIPINAIHVKEPTLKLHSDIVASAISSCISYKSPVINSIRVPHKITTPPTLNTPVSELISISESNEVRQLPSNKLQPSPAHLKVPHALESLPVERSPELPLETMTVWHDVTKNGIDLVAYGYSPVKQQTRKM